MSLQKKIIEHLQTPTRKRVLQHNDVGERKMDASQTHLEQNGLLVSAHNIRIGRWICLIARVVTLIIMHNHVLFGENSGEGCSPVSKRDNERT